jgi:hypothetical protein
MSIPLYIASFDRVMKVKKSAMGAVQYNVGYIYLHWKSTTAIQTILPYTSDHRMGRNGDAIPP